MLEGGVLKWWRLRESESKVRVESQENFAQIPYDYEEIVQEEKETAHAGILQNWANAILHGEPLMSPGRDGLNELTISNAAVSTSRTKPPPSSFSWTPLSSMRDCSYGSTSWSSE